MVSAAMTRMFHPAYLHEEDQDIGELTGTAEYLRNRIHALADVWSDILGREVPFKVQFSDGIGTAATDTKDTIWIREPKDQGEELLFLYHEIGHIAFGTDLGLIHRMIQTAAKSLLRSSRETNIPASLRSRGGVLDENAPLYRTLFTIYNILEDVRVDSLWGMLYPGAADGLLSKSSRKLLLTELERRKASQTSGNPAPTMSPLEDVVNIGIVESFGLDEGVLPTEATDPDFAQEARRAWRVKLQACEGNSAAGVAALFLNLVINDLQPLLVRHEAKKAAEAAAQAAAAQAAKKAAAKDAEGAYQRHTSPSGVSRGYASKTPNGYVLPTTAPSSVPKADPLPQGLLGHRVAAGTSVPAPPDPEGTKLKSAYADRTIVNVRGADFRPEDSAPEDAGALTDDEILDLGRVAMDKRVQELFDALAARSAQEARAEQERSEEIAQRRLVLDMRAARLPFREGEVVTPLPAPSPYARRLSRRIRETRLRHLQRRVESDGMLDVPVVIDAISSGEAPERPFVRRVRKHTGAEIMLLTDISGSMLGEYDAIAQFAADVVAATSNVRGFTVRMWSFASVVWAFKQPCRPNQPCTVAGGTALAASLHAAGVWALRQPKERVVVVVTDGDPTMCLPAPYSTGTSQGDLTAVVENLLKAHVKVIFVFTRDACSPHPKVLCARPQGSSFQETMRSSLEELVTQMAAMRA